MCHALYRHNLSPKHTQIEGHIVIDTLHPKYIIYVTQLITCMYTYLAYSFMLVSLNPIWLSLFSPLDSMMIVSSGAGVEAEKCSGNSQTPPPPLLETWSSHMELCVLGYN